MWGAWVDNQDVLARAGYNEIYITEGRRDQAAAHALKAIGGFQSLRQEFSHEKGFTGRIRAHFLAPLSRSFGPQDNHSAEEMKVQEVYRAAERVAHHPPPRRVIRESA